LGPTQKNWIRIWCAQSRLILIKQIKKNSEDGRFRCGWQWKFIQRDEIRENVRRIELNLMVINCADGSKLNL
jgi:hypothetical protein